MVVGLRLFRPPLYAAKQCSGAQTFWCFEAPQFGIPIDLEAIKTNITTNKLKVVIFDPLYLWMFDSNEGDVARERFASTFCQHGLPARLRCPRILNEHAHRAPIAYAIAI